MARSPRADGAVAVFGVGPLDQALHAQDELLGAVRGDREVVEPSGVGVVGQALVRYQREHGDVGGRFAAERHKADDLAVAGRAYRAVHDDEVGLLAGQQVAGLGGIGGK